jgi:uncharacterized protein (TIGR02284 family)
VPLQKVESDDLKLMLVEFSTQHAHSLGELQNEIERLGNPDPRYTCTVSGILHRTWMQLKVMLTSDHDQAILGECERGDRRPSGVAISRRAKPLGQEDTEC